MEENVKEEKAMVLVIKIFLYGFIAVITLIGVTNIFNTITTNINLRKKKLYKKIESFIGAKIF